MGNQFAGLFFFGILSVLGSAPLALAELQGVARANDGSILRLSQNEAARYCASLHMRLPTAREFAVEAMSFGARPIRETSYPHRDIEVEPVKTEIHRNAAQGFEAIYRKGTGGRTVLDFYFNAQGYQAPAGELEHHFFWSSSLHPFNEHLAYGLAGAVGQLEFEPLSYRLNSAIRCYRY